jgi:hypothetical protein
MRTTLDIEEDILATVKELARKENVSVGKIISRLAREALTKKSVSQKNASSKVGGFRPFASRNVLVTNEAVNELRDQEGV